MNRRTKTIIKISAMMLPIIFFSSTAFANEVDIPMNEHDSMYRYHALENKISFADTASTNIYPTGGNTQIVESEINVKAEVVLKSDDEKLAEITKKQNISIEKSNQVMEVIDGRTGLRTLLLGNSLGVLRFQIVQMQDQIYALEALAKKVDSGTTIVQINDQINILKKQIAKVDKFILKQEDDFSLFGWLLASL
jgi:hypothetical protein